MNLVDNLIFSKIASIIEIIQSNSKQLNLDEIAEKANLNPKEIQQLFKDWAGVEIEQFWQNMRIPKQDKIIDKQQTSLFGISHQSNHQSNHQSERINNSKIHETFVEIIEMTSSELKDEEKFEIDYSFNNTIFGEVLIASTSKGICYLGFFDDRLDSISELKKRFPKARLISKITKIQENTLRIFDSDWRKIEKIKLHLLGTDFQIQVWKKLLQIPTGQLTTYGEIASKILKPKASRAVGTAIGSNPIAFLIPCHRVVQTSGGLGGYMWGENRKLALIGWEASQK